MELPLHLVRLAGVSGHEVVLEVNAAPVTVATVLDALDAAYPMLEGTIREHGTQQRRAWLRFFVCEEDWSHHGMDAVLPEAVVNGKEPLIVLGAIAGG
ncbi:MoaD/ThiS family protein [Terriglobus tenax]|uniref:MoaD/ThiS family protein n=1 Tax=Terriglobus tenax TaxID=1111115 RepID=UPI0021E06988|nr:MoaD/ThiS family protein [Terriglobus tenax]